MAAEFTTIKARDSTIFTLLRPGIPRLRGLDGRYQSVIGAIKARDSTILFDELHEKLIVKELELQTAPSSSSGSPATALNAQSRPKPNRNRPTPQPPVYCPQASQPPTHFRPPPMVPPHPPRPFLGKCQWCREPGHVVGFCPLFRQQHPASRPPPPTRPAFSPSPPQANLTHPGNPNTQYLLDSGASHHLTNDLHNLSLHYPYSGPDELFMGSGEEHSNRSNTH